MRFKSLSVLAASTALLPFLAQAEGLSYSYLDLAYISTDVDRLDEELDGFALRGSIELSEQVFLYAGYSSQSTDIFGTDVDYDQLNLGLGYAWPVNTSTDVYGKIGYVQAEADGRGFEFDDDGYQLAVGLRGRVVDQLELEGALNYVDLSDSGDDTSLGLAARWYFTDQFAGGVEGEFGDDANTYGIYLRWDFGQ